MQKNNCWEEIRVVEIVFCSMVTISASPAPFCFHSDATFCKEAICLIFGLEGSCLIHIELHE